MKRARIAVAITITIGVVALLSGRVTAGRTRVARPLGDVDACTHYDGVPEGFPDAPRAGMVRVRGAVITPGSTHGYRDELPGDAVTVADFDIDRTEVTVAQFEIFVRATDYVTVAERTGGGAVFREPASSQPTSGYAWWQFVDGASFRHPGGPGTTARANEPVVQVAYEDVRAYARWLGRDLPTEAQWELAARAGRHDASIDRAPRARDGKPLANFWQGAFPASNTAEDGFEGRAPVGCYPANGFGLHDAIGNVWEWTRDAHRGSHREAQDPSRQTDHTDAYVIKGGSFLCSADFCARYRPSARHRQEADLSGVHIGFRTVRAVSADPR